MCSYPYHLANGTVHDERGAMDVFRTADAVCVDFDSTLIQQEGIDDLAAFCGKAEQVKALTNQAMKGHMDFKEALTRRLALLRPSLSTIQSFIKMHPHTITKDADVLVEALQRKGADVYLVSGGFRSLIAPVAKKLGIPLENIYANRLKFFFDGEYAGFDESELTCRSHGKGLVIRKLKEEKGYLSVAIVGDGVTDLEAWPPADTFIGFGGNVVRERVKAAAPCYVYDFQTLVRALEDPSED